MMDKMDLDYEVHLQKHEAKISQMNEAKEAKESDDLKKYIEEISSLKLKLKRLQEDYNNVRISSDEISLTNLKMKNECDSLKY